MTPQELLSRDFGTLSDLLRLRAEAHGDKLAFVAPDGVLTYRSLDGRMDRVALALQRDGIGPGHVTAICATTSLAYATAFFGTLRASAVVAPLAPSSTPESLLLQIKDSGAKIVFLDREVAASLSGLLHQVPARLVSLDGSAAGLPFEHWLAAEGEAPVRHAAGPDDPFNIIYSSGTTGAPKGILQPHKMRWEHVRRATYPFEAVTLLSTPLYSNTTLVSLVPTLGAGGTAVLMPKFDAAQYLDLAEKHRATHTMLVPVQYRRLLEHPAFDRHDLSAFQMKFVTSAPFPADLKRQVLDRWPGGLVEFYGMTEGGGTCTLRAHEHPDKLHTVGRPLPGHDIRLIDEAGREVVQGGIGEIVGRSGAMMIGYNNQPGKTAEAEWLSPEGQRFIRTGDIGRFDEDGFLLLMDRKKDMIISGGFNIYPSDLEAELMAHPDVLEAAVVGVASRAWGETPVAFVARKSGATASPDDIKAFVNGRVGKTQRIADLLEVSALPRSHIGKVLKRELRDSYMNLLP